MIQKLRKAAEKAEIKASKINTEVTGNWTHRRAAFAERAQKKKDTLLKYARILSRLAYEWEKGTIPDIAKKITSVSKIEFVFHVGYPRPLEPDHNPEGWYAKEYPTLLKKANKLNIFSKEDKEALVAILYGYGNKELTVEEKRERAIQAKLKEARSYSIPGFFPTPDHVIDIMLEHADIQHHHTILEPSAGIGSIVDKVCQLSQLEDDPKFNITCCELSPSLAEILMRKGYTVLSNDIFGLVDTNNGLGMFDRILMNPPFEKLQDIEHIMYLYNKFLKKDGILVSITSMSWTFSQDKKAKAFRDFLGIPYDGEFFNGSKYMQKLDSCFEQFGEDKNVKAFVLPDGSFEDAFRSTSVQTAMVIIRKNKHEKV